MGTVWISRPSILQLYMMAWVCSSALPLRQASSIRSNSKYCLRMPSSKQKSKARVGSVLE